MRGYIWTWKRLDFRSLWFFEDFDGHLPWIPVTNSTFWTGWPRFDQSGLNKGYSHLRSIFQSVILQISLLRKPEIEHPSSRIEKDFLEVISVWLFSTSAVLKLTLWKVFLLCKTWVTSLKGSKIRSLKYLLVILSHKG